MVTLFEQMVAASGLSAVLAPGVLQRACERAGIAKPERLNRHELLRALPSIENALGMYLSPIEVKERVGALIQLTRSLSSGQIEICLDSERLEDD
jgi:hypothetical protein